jgi:hypothetical protein
MRAPASVDAALGPLEGVIGNCGQINERLSGRFRGIGNADRIGRYECVHNKRRYPVEKASNNNLKTNEL